jgi:hypothetical protein
LRAAEVSGEKGPEERSVVGDLEVEKLVDDGLSAEVVRLLKKGRIEGEAPSWGARCPLSMHAGEMDLSRLHL